MQIIKLTIILLRCVAPKVSRTLDVPTGLPAPNVP